MSAARISSNSKPEISEAPKEGKQPKREPKKINFRRILLVINKESSETHSLNYR